MGAPEHTFSGDRDNRAKQLLKFRKYKKWTQKKLAGEVGCSPTTVYNWEKDDGESTLSDEHIREICEKFDIEAEYFDSQDDISVLNHKKNEDEKEGADNFRQENILKTNCVEDKIVSDFVKLTSEEQQRKEKIEKVRRVDESWDWANLEVVDIFSLSQINDLFSNSFKYIAPLTGGKRRIIFYSPNSFSSFSPGYVNEESIVRKITYDNQYRIAPPIILGMIPHTNEQLDYKKRLFSNNELLKEYMLTGGDGLEEKYRIISCSEGEFDNLEKQFKSKMSSLLNSPEGLKTKLSVFPLVPQPLAVKLGYLLSIFSDLEIYQPHIDSLSWEWSTNITPGNYIIESPPPGEREDTDKILLISLCSNIRRDLITKHFHQDTSIWEITRSTPKIDFLKNNNQLIEFTEKLKSTLDGMQIKNTEKLHIFLSAPIAVAFEIGRLWKQNYGDHELLLYGKANDFEYSLLTTLKRRKI